MRLLMASLFVVAGVSIGLALLQRVPRGMLPPVLEWLVVAVGFLLLCALAGILFNRRGTHPLGMGEGEGDAYLRDLEERGLLESTHFRARRAFELEEVEDEGPHYYLELEDNSVLYLNGQYLYEYEETDDDLESLQPRQFPCTEFTVRRQRKAGYVVDLLCRGQVLEPEVVASPFSERDYRERRIPEDGTVITNRTYDQIKEERLGA